MEGAVQLPSFLPPPLLENEGSSGDSIERLLFSPLPFFCDRKEYNPPLFLRGCSRRNRGDDFSFSFFNNKSAGRVPPFLFLAPIILASPHQLRFRTFSPFLSLVPQGPCRFWPLLHQRVARMGQHDGFFPSHLEEFVLSLPCERHRDL